MKESVESLIDLTGFSDEDCRVLRNSAERTRLWADEFVKMFYDKLFSYPHTAELFQEGERPQREQTVRDWYLKVVGGELDSDFWAAQCQVGQRHIHRKILNSYMHGMMNLAQDFFLEKSLAAFPREEGVRLFQAFKRATDVAAGIIAESYHSPYAVMKVGR